MVCIRWPIRGGDAHEFSKRVGNQAFTETDRVVFSREVRGSRELSSGEEQIFPADDELFFGRAVMRYRRLGIWRCG